MTTSTAKDRTALTVLPAVAPAAGIQGSLAGEGTLVARLAKPGNHGHECVSLPGTGLDAAAKSVARTVEISATTREDRVAQSRRGPFCVAAKAAW